MDLTPRLRFQENKEYVSFHKELVVSDRFRAAAEAALLQTVMALPETALPEEATANWHRIEGSRAFLRAILNIAESPVTLPGKPTQNLTR